MKYDQEDSPIEQIAAWLYSVARSQIIDRSRKHREKEMPYLSASEEDGTFLKELAELMPDEDQSPEMDYIRSTVWEELEHALLELPDEQRAVFELTELEGFPFKEISYPCGYAQLRRESKIPTQYKSGTYNIGTAFVLSLVN